MPEQISEDFDAYDRFVDGQKTGHLLQSSRWGDVKREWTFRAFVLRSGGGKIRASAGLLTRRVPVIGTLAYLPRGPVFPPGGEADGGELLSGVQDFCKSSGCFTLLCDPYLREGESRFPAVLKELGFRPEIRDRSEFGGIQPRYLATRSLEGLTEEKLIASFSAKTRYNLRLAGRKGVCVRLCGEEQLDEFQRLMAVTSARDGFTARPAVYFRNFLTALGDRARLYLAYCGNEAVAGAVATRFSGRVTYNYGASDNRLRETMPNYPLQLAMMRWGLENGCGRYDFGGVPGCGDETDPLYGLTRFKAGFGGQFTRLIGEYRCDFRPLAARAFRAALALRH